MVNWSSSRNKKSFIDKTVMLFSRSAKKIDRLKISDIFTAKSGWIGDTISFDVGTFTSSSEMFHDANTWTNGYGAFSELIAVFGEDAMTWFYETNESPIATFTLMRDLTNEGVSMDAIKNMTIDEKIKNCVLGIISKLAAA